MWKVVFAAWLLAAGCGRIGFDASGVRDGDATGDVAITDAFVSAMVPSCVGLAATCGPLANTICCESPIVPGGTYLRGFDTAADNMYMDNSNPATVSTFRLDAYEITVGRFRTFVEAGQGTRQSPPPDGAGARTLNGVANQGGWSTSWNSSLAVDTNALSTALGCGADATWTASAGTNETAPINCITQYDAMAFCAWDGGFLPTEAEWNYAAAGGAEQRAYPWSNPADSLTIDCAHASYYDGGMSCSGGPRLVGEDSPTGDGRWGHADLAGNVHEWNLDSYEVVYPSPCDDCANLTATNQRSVRSGDFDNSEPQLRVSYRDYIVPPSYRGDDIGARCARLVQ